MKKHEPTKEKVSAKPIEFPYAILTADCRRGMEETASEWIERGWVLVGPAFPVASKDGLLTFFQTVVRANVPVK